MPAEEVMRDTMLKQKALRGPRKEVEVIKTLSTFWEQDVDFDRLKRLLLNFESTHKRSQLDKNETILLAKDKKGKNATRVATWDTANRNAKKIYNTMFLLPPVLSASREKKTSSVFSQHGKKSVCEHYSC